MTKEELNKLQIGDYIKIDSTVFGAVESIYSGNYQLKIKLPTNKFKVVGYKQSFIISQSEYNKLIETKNICSYCNNKIKFFSKCCNKEALNGRCTACRKSCIVSYCPKCFGL